MTTLRQAARRVLGAWDGGEVTWFADCYDVMDALRAALAEQDEPVAWPAMPPSKGQSPVLFEDGYAEGWAKCLSMCKSVFEHTNPQPPRQPLTREDAIALWKDRSDGPSNAEIVSYCRAVEAAHGITGEQK